MTVQQQNLNEAVNQEVSKYSESLRNRLGKITDFKGEFDRAFDGFVENALPKDDIYAMIEKQMAARKSGKSGDPLASPKKAEEPILPPVDVPKADQLAQKMAKTRAAQEMETNERVLEEEKQNFITRQEAAKEKKKKKGKAIEDDDVPSQKEANKQNEEIKYAMGDQYDQERADLARVDYEYEQLLAKAKVKALKNNEMQVYDDLEQKKMNRA